MEDQISTIAIAKEFITLVKLLLSKIKLIIITSFLGGIAFFFSGNFFFKNFESVSTFSKASDSGGALSSYLALASQFGIAGGNETSGDKLAALIKSDRVIITSLLENVDGEKLINYYCNVSNIKKSWVENDNKLRNFTFTSNSYENLTFLEDSLLEKSVLKPLRKKIEVDIDKETNIITLRITDKDEKFAFHFNNLLVSSVTEYFVEQSAKKEKETYKVLKKSLDSVLVELKIKENELAKVKDQGRGIVKIKGSIEEIRLTRDVKILSLMYSEGLKNLEIAKITFLEKKAVVDVIDYPILPLEQPKLSKLILIIIGMLLFGGIISAFIILKHYINFKELWKNENLH